MQLPRGLCLWTVHLPPRLVRILSSSISLPGILLSLGTHTCALGIPPMCSPRPGPSCPVHHSHLSQHHLLPTRRGDTCDCSPASSPNNEACIRPGDVEPCSGRGECLCGKCQCYSEDLRQRFDGPFCQYDVLQCPRTSGFLCNGKSSPSAPSISQLWGALCLWHRQGVPGLVALTQGAE